MKFISFKRIEPEILATPERHSLRIAGDTEPQARCLRKRKPPPQMHSAKSAPKPEVTNTPTTIACDIIKFHSPIYRLNRKDNISPQLRKQTCCKTYESRESRVVNGEWIVENSCYASGKPMREVSRTAAQPSIHDSQFSHMELNSSSEIY